MADRRVLVVGMHYAPETTGNAPYTTGLARSLHRSGFEVSVLAGLPHYPQWRVAPGYGRWRSTETVDGVHVTRLWHPVPKVPTASKRVFMDGVFSARTALARIPRPDVVVAISPILLSVGASLALSRRWRVPLGVVTQDLYSRALVETKMTTPAVARAGAWLEGALLGRADGVAAVHDTFVPNLQRLGVSADRVRVIRNWTHVAEAASTIAATRRRLGWAHDDIIALHAGNMGVKQGLENVVAAARMAGESNSRVRFVLLGDGGRRPHLEAAARGVVRVSFTDPLPAGEFEDALAAADVLLLNEAESVAEMSVPSKLTSYFSAGRPVVAASHAHSAASAEIERSGGGVRVEPGQPADLLRAVSDVHGSDEAVEMGERGKKYAAANLDEQTATESYIEWITDLLESGVHP